MLSLQLTLVGSSSQCAPVRPSSPRWNDQRNDQRAWAADPGRHADQSAGSPVECGGGSVRPEVVGVLLTSGSNRAGWLHYGLATRRDRTTATRSAQPR